MKSFVLRVVAGCVAMLAVGTGVALATGAIANPFVAADGSITACVQKSSGVTKIVAPGQACQPSDTAVSFNQTGPTGATGPTGPTGATGPAGTDGADGADGTDGADGADGRSIQASPIAASSSECGGNGGYDLSYSDGSPIGPICNGANGLPGADGAPGAPGAALVGSPCTIPPSFAGTVQQTVAPNGAISLMCQPAANADSDGDGVTNAHDNCPFVSNPDQADADQDGLGDACDDATGNPNDTDSDGVANAVDNCPMVANPDQADNDADGIGNACDPTPNGGGQTSPEVCDGLDNDGDGVVDDLPAITVPHGIAHCVGAQIVVLTCDPGFADVDNNGVNGCEIDLLTDVQNCGAPGAVVQFANAVVGCVNGVGVIVACFPGWMDADGFVANGCEFSLFGGGSTGLVINEVDYDQVGTDGASFIELYNAGTAPIGLSGLAVDLVNGNDRSVYDSIGLGGAGGSIPVGGYLVIGNSSVLSSLPLGVMAIDAGTTDFIQNGAPDGIALVDQTNGVLLDALSYEGAITNVTLPGLSGPVSLVEGTALSASTADSNTLTGSLGRFPSGTDTNNAAVDWHFSQTLTPGAANSP